MAYVAKYDKFSCYEGCVAGEPLNEGDLVYLVTATGLWRKAVNTAVATAAQGVAGATVNAAGVTAGHRFTVWTRCIVEGLTGLTVGARVFSDPATAGGYTNTIPAVAGDVVQPVGFSPTATRVNVDIVPPIAAIQAAAVSTLASV